MHFIWGWRLHSTANITVPLSCSHLQKLPNTFYIESAFTGSLFTAHSTILENLKSSGKKPLAMYSTCILQAVKAVKDAHAGMTIRQMEVFTGKMQTRRQIVCFALGKAWMQTFKLKKLPFPSVAPLSHYINYLELFTYFPSFRPQVQKLSMENYFHSFFWSEKTIYGNTHHFLSEIHEGEKGWHPNTYIVFSCCLISYSKTEKW